MSVTRVYEALVREPLPQRIAREAGPILGLFRSVDLPPVWVLGQKKAGTSLAANFVSQGLYGCDAAIDLPVRRWLQRWLLPTLFRDDPARAVEAIARVQRARVVKEPNLCYYVRALAPVLDGRAEIVYVTRQRPEHLRSILDRILERRDGRLHIRRDLNFIWRGYTDTLGPGAAVDDAALARLITSLGQRFDRIEADCLEVLGKMTMPALVIGYEAIVDRRPSNPLRATLSARWPRFDWDRASATLGVQHQPRGDRLVDAALIGDVLASSAAARTG